MSSSGDSNGLLAVLFPLSLARKQVLDKREPAFPLPDFSHGNELACRPNQCG
jgi:hypothetical protein